MSNILIVDNGAYTIKIGYSTDTVPKIIPNCTTKVKSERRRPFIGDQLEDCKDYSGLFYILPFQKGYLINWDLQRQIWDYVFKTKLKVDTTDTTLIMTEPYLNFKSIKENMTEILFEEYGFASLLRTNAGQLACYKYNKENVNSVACVIIDSGYSFTHIVPYIKGNRFKDGITRIDIGGKALTNHLKDIISYRQLNVMDETYVVNQIKEDCCFVSTQFWNDLETAKTKKNYLSRDYVLPDYTVIKRGFVRDPNDPNVSIDQQVIRVNNERFQVPELLFYPSDVGINEIGISHAIPLSIGTAPQEVRPHLYENVLLIGGNAAFQGIKERVHNDLRSMAPYLYDINVTLPPNPITYSWDGGKLLANNSDELRKLCISKREYEENGLNFCIEKFEV